MEDTYHGVLCHANSPGTAANARQPAMVALGALLFPVFLWYEWKYPRKPVMPMRWLTNGPILGACLIGFFDFTSFYLQGTYLYS